MDLKTFVADTLVQIVEGVEEAREKIDQGSTNAVVNPVVSHAFHNDPENVTFDVAVTVADEASKGGKAGIKVFSAEIGGGVDSKVSNQAATHIKFNIPLAVPSTPKEQYKDMGSIPWTT